MSTQTRDAAVGSDRPQDEIIIHGELVREILKANGLKWIVLGVLGAALLCLAALILVPITYTSTVSIAVQQSAAPSTVSSLLIGSNQATRYVGIIKSRWAASQAEDSAHLQQLYHLKSRADALEMIMKDTVATDKPDDGLFYVAVNLPGPPRLLPWSSRRAALVKQAAANAANAYAAALRRYYLTSDTDRDTVLLRAADDEVRAARDDYDSAIASALAYSRLHDVDPKSPAAEVSDTNAVSPSELSGLYSSLYDTQDQIRQSDTELALRREGTEQELSQVGNLSTEDPLLTKARSRVQSDEISVRALSQYLGSDNPQLTAAQAQLEADRSALNDEMRGEHEGLTTDQVLANARLNGLRARQALIENQIGSVQRRLSIVHGFAGEYGRLEEEVIFAADALKVATEEATKVRMENVSAASRMQVIDSAIPANKGTPSLLMLVLASVVLACLGVLNALARKYGARARKLANAAPGYPPGPSFNGARPEAPPIEDRAGDATP